MLHPPVTISIAFVQGMLAGIQSSALSCDEFLADAGIAKHLLQKEWGRVTAEQYVALFRLLIDRLEDESLGFLLRPLKRGSFALVARSAIGSPTLDVAMRRVARTFWLLQDDVKLEPLREGALVGLSLRFADPVPAGRVFLHELLLRVFWRLLAWLAGGELTPVRFDFEFPRPSYAVHYRRIFPATLHFDRTHSAFWFDCTRLQGAVLRDETSLRAFIADAPANVIVPRRTGVHTARIRSFMQRTQPPWPDLVTSAAALHTSVSTLQRRLASEGTSFQLLKDELRRDLAIVRLTTSVEPLAKLAHELGFADSAAFQRAFKGWTGSAPGSYRRCRA